MVRTTGIMFNKTLWNFISILPWKCGQTGANSKPQQCVIPIPRVSIWLSLFQGKGHWDDHYWMGVNPENVIQPFMVCTCCLSLWCVSYFKIMSSERVCYLLYFISQERFSSQEAFHCLLWLLALGLDMILM